jgi:polyphosphate glucokinase
MEVLGIDIGGSGIKGAPVDVTRGVLVGERFRVVTPQPSTPPAVASAVAEVARQFDWQGPIGVTFPAIVRHGVTLSAANVDQAWIGTDAQALFGETTHCPVVVINDADAAGVAEMVFGAGRDMPGVVMMLTFGTGIGSALFVDGRLVPNTELGHLVMHRGKETEHFASDRIRADKDLSWKKWAKRVNEVLAELDALFSPDLYIIGGGVSKNYSKFGEYLRARARIVPAQSLNEAGIIGAAMVAANAAGAPASEVMVGKG